MKKIIPILLASFLCAGCQTGHQEFNWKTFRFERVGPRDVYRPVAEADKPTTLEEMGQIPSSGRQPLAGMSAERQSALERSQICRLYISKEMPKHFDAGENVYLAVRAPVDKLSEVLVLLYPAQGPGGGDRIRYLLYRSDNVLEQAKTMAGRLDVPPVSANNLGEAFSTWELAIGLLYSSDYPRKIDAERRTQVVSLLNQVIENPAEDRNLRWAAAIVAGHIQKNYEPQDLVMAGASFARAMDFTAGPSYQGMVAQLHAARLLLERHQPLSAKKQAMDALNFYQRWDSTECYDSLRNIAMGKQ